MKEKFDDFFSVFFWLSCLSIHLKLSVYQVFVLKMKELPANTAISHHFCRFGHLHLQNDIFHCPCILCTECVRTIQSLHPSHISAYSIDVHCLKMGWCNFRGHRWSAVLKASSNDFQTNTPSLSLSLFFSQIERRAQKTLLNGKRGVGGGESKFDSLAVYKMYWDFKRPRFRHVASYSDNQNNLI